MKKLQVTGQGLQVTGYKLQVFRLLAFNLSSCLRPCASCPALPAFPPSSFCSLPSAFCSLQVAGCLLQVWQFVTRADNQRLGRKGNYGISGTIRGSGGVAGIAAVTPNHLFRFKTTGVLPGLGTQRTDSPRGSIDDVQHCRRIRTRQQEGVHPFFNRCQRVERRSSLSTLRSLRPGILERSGIQFHAQLSSFAFSKAIVVHSLSGKLPGQRTLTNAGNCTFVKAVGCHMSRVTCHASSIKRQVKSGRSANGEPVTCNLQPVTSGLQPAIILCADFRNATPS